MPQKRYRGLRQRKPTPHATYTSFMEGARDFQFEGANFHVGGDQHNTNNQKYSIIKETYKRQNNRNQDDAYSYRPDSRSHSYASDNSRANRRGKGKPSHAPRGYSDEHHDGFEDQYDDFDRSAEDSDASEEEKRSKSYYTRRERHISRGAKSFIPMRQLPERSDAQESEQCRTLQAIYGGSKTNSLGTGRVQGEQDPENASHRNVRGDRANREYAVSARDHEESDWENFEDAEDDL